MTYPYRKVAIQLSGLLLLAVAFFAAFVYRVPDPLSSRGLHGVGRPSVAAAATTSTTNPVKAPRTTTTTVPASGPTTTSTTFGKNELDLTSQAKKVAKPAHLPTTLPGALLLTSGPILTSTPIGPPSATADATKPVGTTATTSPVHGTTTTTAPNTTTTAPPGTTTTTTPPSTTTSAPSGTTTTTAPPSTTTTAPGTTTTGASGG